MASKFAVPFKDCNIPPFPVLSSPSSEPIDGSAMSEAESGVSSLSARESVASSGIARPSCFRDVARLKAALKPFVTTAAFIGPYKKSTVQPDKIMEDQAMLMESRKIDAPVRFNLEDFEAVLYEIYEERTADGEDMGLSPADVTG